MDSGSDTYLAGLFIRCLVIEIAMGCEFAMPNLSNTLPREDFWQRVCTVFSVTDHFCTKDLATWKVKWDIMAADFEKWKATFNTKASQLDACQRQRDYSTRELQESKIGQNNWRPQTLRCLVAWKGRLKRWPKSRPKSWRRSRPWTRSLKTTQSWLRMERKKKKPLR